MSTDISGTQRKRNLHKRINAEGGGFSAGYPCKAFKAVVETPTDAAASPGEEFQFSTPFQQPFKETYSTPSTGRTLTPCTPKLSGKRDIVQRLRQQLKNRDEIIMQMQTQMLEQARVVQFHQLRVGDLEVLLTDANRSLYVAEQEIESLRKVLADCCSCQSSSCQVRKGEGLFHRQVEGQNGFRAQKECLVEKQHRDMQNLVAEARRLTERIKAAGVSKRYQERKCEKEAQRMRSELLEAKSLATKNASLFEACDKEREKLSGTLKKLQQNLEFQAIKLEHRRASRFADKRSDQSSNTIDACAPGCSASLSSVSTGLETGSGDYTADFGGFQSPPPAQKSWDDHVSRLSFDLQKVAVGDEERDRISQESPAVRIGSPEVYVRRRPRKNSSGESTGSSFKRFVFDMDRDSGGGIVMLNHTDESYFGARGLPAAASETMSVGTLSPFSKMVSKLDLLQASPAASLTDSLIVAEKIERSIGSVDSAFDRILDNTLDDIVRVCSPSHE